MKIQSLDLIAFGPFTQKSLEFGKTPAGMTVVFGANEAGKSSALRAIRGALYGIPNNTDDNFLHSYQKLRIGVELLDQHGNIATYIRRKGRTDTLLTTEGDTADESQLIDLCHGIPESLFNSLFGITHQDLTEGGKDILNQQGELGQALFSASSARKSLHLTLKQLDDAANALFTPKGKNQPINAGLKLYGDLKSKLSETALSSADWATLRQAYEETAELTDAVALEIKACDQKLNELKRYERLLPKVALRARLASQVSELANVKQLDEKFAARRQKAETELATARASKQSVQARYTELSSLLESDAVDRDLLPHETTLQSLYQSLESFIRAEKELPLLSQRYTNVESELSNILQTIQPGLAEQNIEQLLVLLSREPDIKSSVAGHQSLQLERKQLSTSLLTAEEKLNQLKVVDAVDEALLLRAEKAFQNVQPQSGIETEINRLASDIVNLEAKTTALIAALPHWQGSLDELALLPVPGKQTLQKFSEQLSTKANEQARLDSDLQRVSTDLQLAHDKIEGLKQGGDLPSKTELEEIRNSRNNAWGLLKEHWLQGVDVTLEAGFLDPQRKLPEAFEWRMHSADDIADKLRRDSDRVAQLESFKAELKRHQKQKLDIEDLKRVAEQSYEKTLQEWAAEWSACGISPRTPGEMQEWRLSYTEILKHGETLSDLRLNHERRIATKNELISSLLIDSCEIDSRSLASAVASMGVWIEINRNAAQLHKQYKLTKTRLEEELALLRNSLALNDKALLEWREHWETITSESGMTAISNPDSALDRLQQIREAFTKKRELREIDASVSKVTLEIENFTASHLQLAISPADKPLAQHVSELYRQFSVQKQAEAVRQQNQAELTKLKSSLGTTSQALESSQAVMNALFEEAGCKSEAEFPTLERLSAELSHLKQQLATIEHDILQDGGGKSLSELEHAVQPLDSSTVASEIKVLSQRISNELEPRKQQLSEERGAKGKELESMDGGDEVASIAEAAENTLATLQKDVVEYMQLKTAAKLLRDEIERFRKANQGPLLEIAGKYFSELTLGAYSGLGSDFSEQDTVVLTATRANGDSVLVEGLSNGTRDQLYLALRLAAFERSIEQRGPMPFIVDDILIEFDDARSQAALEIFSRLSKKTQIILFTHHPRIRELSEELAITPAIVTL